LKKKDPKLYKKTFRFQNLICLFLLI